MLDKEKSEINAMFVDPAAQGKGIGSKILAELENKAHEYGLAKLTLDATLSSLKFYKNAGYKTLEKGHYELSNGTKLESWKMEKHLD